MNEAERFEIVLEELRGLVADLQLTGVGVMLVGGQVLSLEDRARGGDGVIQVSTPTGVRVRRGYSMEPDLLFDLEEAGARAECVLDVLRQRGFKRIRDYRWSKPVEGGAVLIDVFAAAGIDDACNPGGFTYLPAGDLALAGARMLRVVLSSGTLEVRIPDAVGFLAMKLHAKLLLRPTETKDSFDVYAYVAAHGAEAVAASLQSSGERDKVVAGLRALFADVGSPGVRDVVA